MRKIEGVIQNKEIFVFLFQEKQKKRYYESLNKKRVVHNKLFCKTVKPFISNKVAGKDKIRVTENN